VVLFQLKGAGKLQNVTQICSSMGLALRMCYIIFSITCGSKWTLEEGSLDFAILGIP